MLCVLEETFSWIVQSETNIKLYSTSIMELEYTSSLHHKPQNWLSADNTGNYYSAASLCPNPVITARDVRNKSRII